MSEWISVKDRMPPDDDAVLVFWLDDEGDECFRVDRWLDMYTEWQVYDGEYTHWMPLPEAPK